MESIINYIAESAVCLGILTLFYYSYVRQRNMPAFSRWYLLASLLFTAILPLIHLSIDTQISVDNGHPNYYGYMLGMVNIYGTLLSRDVVPAVQQHSSIQWFYMLGFLLLVSRLLIALYSIGALQRRTRKEKIGNITLVLSEKIFQPFSFLNTIFVPNAFWEEEESQSILKHEIIHVKQKHTFDLIILELILLVQWFNPFAWLLRKAISENHEFLADRAVLDSGISVSDYQKTLLYQVMGTKFNLGTGFSYSLTKKRFKMMKTKVNNKRILRSSILSLLLFSGLFFVAATELYHDEFSPKITSINSKEATDKNDEQEEVIFQVVEKMPSFPGGTKAMIAYITNNVDYPKVAAENGISGKVLISFVINKEGEVVDAKVARSIDPSLDKEALRVINAMPKWKPGQQRGKNVNVAFTMPINFALEQDNQVTILTTGAGVSAETMRVTDRSIIPIDGKHRVTGKLVDVSGKALPGASVIIKETHVGTVTDMNGTFSLDLEKEDQIVVISFVGKKSLSLKFSNHSNEQIDEEVLFQIVEEMPQFPGGEEALNKFLIDNLKYPNEAKKNGISGRVYSNFTVSKDGSIKDVKIVRGVNPLLDAEALRVINSMPRWIPGKQSGKTVNVSYMLPINFALDPSTKKD